MIKYWRDYNINWAGVSYSFLLLGVPVSSYLQATPAHYFTGVMR